MESLEQELITMLRRLPVPVTITWRSGQYRWQYAQGTGQSPHLITAVEEALRFLLCDQNARVGVEERRQNPGDSRASS
jgi:hypothetical protein